MGRLTKEQRRLRDAFRDGTFAVNLARMADAARLMSVNFDAMAASVNAIQLVASYSFGSQSGRKGERMTETEQKIVRVLENHGALTLCEMYQHLNMQAGDCELDAPLGDLAQRCVLRAIGKRQCAWGNNVAFALSRKESP